ncbi:ATP-binding protein [Halorarum halophilum]|uniref:ATP-binding protein n=1 Tax=Halorarum halophilum TaxID=2743090 RepID=A0A7D5GN77_9EURY|nr:ATP-binding protein [Halobaculum halophilum]QLG29124.1 ATP-binding protein [Halobaculum halophilum]
MDSTQGAGSPSRTDGDGTGARPALSDTGSARSALWDRLPMLLGGLALVLFVSLADRWFIEGESAPPLFSVDTLTAVVFVVPLAIGFGYGGYWLQRSSISRQRFRRIGYWCGGGIVVFLGVNLAIMATWPPESPAFAFGWGRFSFAVGGVGGLLMGIIEARSIERGRAAERAVTRAEMAEDQQKWFDYLNGLLRHEILNTVNVLSGNVTLLVEENDLDDETLDRLETVQRQCRNMELVIRDVRVLIEATTGDAELGPVDLADVVADEVQDLRDAHGSATVEVDVPETLPVVADELAGRVFSNLLTNAVKHNDGENPVVRVTARESDDWVVCRVEDDGPGVPDWKRENLFERSNDGGTDHGLGLYLVRTLIERYRGTVELTETGPAGSVFTVVLPRAAGRTTVAGEPDGPADVGDGDRDVVDPPT